MKHLPIQPTHCFLLAFAALWLGVLTATSQAQMPLHSIPAPPVGVQSGAQLGYSSATDGNYVVVGAPYDDLLRSDSGLVKVFDATTGALLLVIPNPSPAVDDRFGNSVAISGTRVVVGAYQDDTGATNAGSAYVYDLSSGTPTVPVQTLNNPGPGLNDRFGNSVAISGTLVVVGAYQDDTGAQDAGSAYVYDLSSGTPTVPTQTLNNPGPAIGDNFGNSVAISGTRVVVGACQDDTGAVDAGSAYVYDLSSGTPTLPTQALNNPGPGVDDRFGSSVATDGVDTVIGTPYDDSPQADKGSVYIFTAPTSVTASTADLAINATTLTITGAFFDANTPSNNTVAFTPTGTGTVTASTATSLTVTSLSGLSVGALNAVVTTNGHSSGAPVQVAVVVAPEISITGNGVDIPHGDMTPAAADGTHYQSVALLNAQVSHSFTLANTGTLALHLTGSPLVTLSGPGVAAFEVTLTPASTVEAGGSTTFAITFDPTLPGLHTATVTILSDATNHPSFSFDISGNGVLTTPLKQTLTFAPPATVYLGQSPLSLSTYSSSGLPVTLSVVPSGTTVAGAAIAGDALSFTGTGTIKVQAVQAGDGLYAAAPTVVKTITVKANPTTLTLLNLAQIYKGTPRAINTLGGSGVVTVEYKFGTTFGNTVPTNAGSYAVRAIDSKGTKTGTLVITKAPLYVTPDDKSKFVGQDNPPLTLSYTGLVNAESASVVTKAPVLKTTATKTSVGGVYAITASGGVVSPNYAFIYQQGALVVDSFAASYEALLTDSSGRLNGKLAIIVAAGNTSFTGKLYCIDEKAALSLNGPLVTNPGTESATGGSRVTSGGIPYDISITLQIDGSLTASITRSGAAYASGTGRRLLTLGSGKSALYSGAHTAVMEPATPASNNVPAGAGWATAAISTKGVMTFVGRLGDGASFTTALTPDDISDPTYLLFLQPYKTGAATRLQSHFGGAFTLLPHPTLTGRRYVESAALSWVKPGLSTDDSYRVGFGTVTPVNTVLLLDPWLPPAAAKVGSPAIPLATRLGLTNSNFEVRHSATGSTLNGNLPTRAGLSTTNAVAVTTPTANTTKWKTTLVPATGLFSGSFELADTTPKPRVVPFTGVLRQPASAPDTLIGDGHYLLPPLSGTEKTTGEVMFLRP